MVSAGFPVETDVMKESNYVFSFPIRSPEGAVCADEVGALEQLSLWKTYQDHWCEHKPSITVYYRDDEFLDVCSWMWKNFDVMSGIALLPYSDHTYQQAPYQKVDEEDLQVLEGMMPVFDWEQAAVFESETDSTTGSQELACVGGACEIA
jgi:ribonucleoside-diphosphate reductase alpha chain